MQSPAHQGGLPRLAALPLSLRSFAQLRQLQPRINLLAGDESVTVTNDRFRVRFFGGSTSPPGPRVARGTAGNSRTSHRTHTSPAHSRPAHSRVGGNTRNSKPDDNGAPVWRSKDVDSKRCRSTVARNRLDRNYRTETGTAAGSRNLHLGPGRGFGGQGPRHIQRARESAAFSFGVNLRR